jgi:hypothetical protein
LPSGIEFQHLCDDIIGRWKRIADFGESSSRGTRIVMNGSGWLFPALRESTGRNQRETERDVHESMHCYKSSLREQSAYDLALS